MFLHLASVPQAIFILTLLLKMSSSLNGPVVSLRFSIMFVRLFKSHTWPLIAGHPSVTVHEIQSRGRPWMEQPNKHATHTLMLTILCNKSVQNRYTIGTKSVRVRTYQLEIYIWLCQCFKMLYFSSSSRLVRFVTSFKSSSTLCGNRYLERHVYYFHCSSALALLQWKEQTRNTILIRWSVHKYLASPIIALWCIFTIFEVWFTILYHIDTIRHGSFLCFPNIVLFSFMNDDNNKYIYGIENTVMYNMTGSSLLYDYRKTMPWCEY